jgi:hypothetical protein
MPTLEELVDRMDRRPAVRAAILAHIRAQRGVPAGYVKLDDGTLARVGSADDDDDD